MSSGIEISNSQQQTVQVGVLGCTGSVGQRFIQLLEGHPWFQLKALGASSRSAGKTYANAVSWKMTSKIPERVASLVVQECKPENFKGCKIIFSALDSDVAGTAETEFAKAGFAVFSNSKNHRMGTLMPLVVPTCNIQHLDMVKDQMQQLGTKGFIVTNANCSTTGLVTALKPIHEKFGVKTCQVFTMQSLSGAGYPGVASMDILDNVIPYISGEEDKLETEPNKILGAATPSGIKYENIALSAHCNRVGVTDGHTMSVSLATCKAATAEEIADCLRQHRPDIMATKVPSVSQFNAAIEVTDEPARPQPRLDRDAGNGYTVTVGRVRECPILGVKFTLLVHNTVLGAAGSSILNAEASCVRGLVA